MSIYERELRRFHRAITMPAWVMFLQIIALAILIGAVIAFGVIWGAVIYWTLKVNPVWGLVLTGFTLLLGAIGRSRK